MSCINPKNPEFQALLKEIGNPLLAEIEFDRREIKKSSILLQKKGTESSTASPKVIELVKNLMKKVGVDIVAMKEIVVNGVKYDVNGVADILQKLIQVVEGKEEGSLPEEAMHFVVEILKQKNPALYKKLLKEINSYNILKLVYQEYGNDENYQTPDGKPDVIKLKEEAIAKLLVETVIKKIEGVTEKPELMEQSRSVWKQIMDFLKGLFYSSGFDKVAMSVITGEFEGNVDDIRVEQEKLYFQKTKQETLFESMRDTADKLTGKDENGYIYEGNRINRVHDLIRSWYDRVKNDLTKTEFEKALADLYKDKGTAGHADLEHAFGVFVDKKTGLLRETPLDDDVYVSQLDENDIKKYEILKENLKQRLATYPEGTRFLSEVFVYENRIWGGKKGLGGTIDFVAIKPDGKVDILDWKFFTLNTDRYTDIPWYKMNEWDQQMTQYKLMLQRSYGVKSEDFGQTRMIPILVVYDDVNFREEELPTLKKIKIGDVEVKNIEQDYLLPFATKDERTGDNNIDKWIDKLNAIYERVSSRAAVTETEKKDRIDQLNQIIKTVRHLQIKKDIEPLIYQAQLLVKQAEAVMEKYKTIYKENDPSSFPEKEINDFTKELDDYLLAIHEYTRIDAELKHVFPAEMSEEDKKLKEELKEVANTAREIEIQLSDAFDSFISETVVKREGIDAFSKPERIIKGLVRWFSTTSLLQTRAIQFLYKKANKMLSFAGFETNDQILKIKQLEDDFKKWANNKGLTRNNMFNIIKKKDKNELIDEFKKEFYSELKKRIADKDFDWIRNNVDVEETKRIIEEKRKEEVERIKNKTIVKAEDKERYERTGELPRSHQKEIDKANRLYDTSTASSPGWLLYELVKQSPIRSTWESEQWKELHKPENAPAKAFYDYIIERNHEYQKIGYINNPRTFLPFVEKGLVERIATGGKLRPGERFLRNISVDENETGYGQRDQLSGEIMDIVPKYFVNEVDNAEVSDDLFRTISLYNQAAIRFKYLKLIDNQVRGVLRVERNKKAIRTSMFGKTDIKDGVVQTINDNSENAKLYEDMMKMIIYGQRYLQSETFDQALVKLGTWGEKLNKKLGVDIFPENLDGRQISFNKSVDSVNNFFQLTTLGFNFLSAGSNYVGGTLQSIINSGKFFTRLDWAGAQLKLASNALSTEERQKFFSAVNYFLPLTDDLNRDLIKNLTLDKMSPSAVQDALMILMRKSDRVVQYTNFYAYLRNSIVIDGEVKNVREYLRTKDKYKNKYHLSSAERESLDKEFEEELEQLIAEKGILNVAKIEKGEFYIPGVDRMSESVVEFRRKVQQLNKDALGNMSEDDLRRINSIVLGKSFMIFKNWIPRPLDVRFGSMKYNSASDAYEWGRTRTFFRALSFEFLNTLSALGSSIAGNNDEFVAQMLKLYEVKKHEYETSTGKDFTMTSDEFVDMVRRNIKSQLYDAIFLATLASLVVLIKAMPDDDDDDEVKNIYRFFAKGLDKFRDELLYFYDITSFQNFVSKGFFPSMSLIENMRKGTVNFMKECYGLVWEDDKFVEDNKVIKYWLKSFPFTNQMTGYLPMFYPEAAKDLGIKMQSNYGMR